MHRWPTSTPPAGERAHHREDIRKSARESTALVFAIAFAWLACTAGWRALFLPDEGRYVGVAWEMLHSGNWLTPTLDGLPFFHKPPLFYWLTATALRLFGPHEWAARLPSLLAASATVVLVHACLRDWLDDRIARVAALVLATQPLFFAAAQFANLDMLVATCISASVLCAARAALRMEGGLPYRHALAASWIAAALGVLAKGLIGLVLPALVLVLWLGLARRWRTLRRLCWVPGLAAFVVLTVPWFAAMQWQFPAFLHYFFVVQQVKRYAGGGFNNVQAFWFYVPVLAVLALPWSAWLLVRGRTPRASATRRPAVTSLMWIWLATVLVFFSIPQSKLIGYALPACAPLAGLIAFNVAPLLAMRRGHAWWRISVGTAAALCMTAAAVFAMLHGTSSRELGLALAKERAAGEGIAFIDAYAYDLPFYLNDSPPVIVISDWDPAEVGAHDNWRKELADAGAFAPLRAADRLVDGAQLQTLLCSGRVRWIVAGRDPLVAYPFLGEAVLVRSQGERVLWHADIANPRFAKAVGCAPMAVPPLAMR